jgi:glyceraldehyde-3-phosphate dehydrogenase (NAD(P))
MQKRVRVAVNGYGVIGKRVADAVALQEDMSLTGVADIVSDYRIRVAAERGYRVYASPAERRLEMEAAGIPIFGVLDDLLRECDVVVDCAPKKVAATNKARYEAAGVKAIFQGGEKHELTGYPFVVSIARTDAALGIVKAFLPATTRPIAHEFGPEIGHPAVQAVRAARAEFMDVGFKGAEEPAEPVATAEQRHGGVQ